MSNGMKTYNVAVLRGGPSEEYDVSMRTGASVLQALEDSPFATSDVVISRAGSWLVDGFERTPENALAATDVVFIALHGAYGEDGGVQRLLDRLGIPYTGSGAYASNVAMNKVLTKELLADSGITMPRSMKVSNDVPDVPRLLESIESLFGPEYVVKPINGGSSIDTHLISGQKALREVVLQSLKKYEAVLVEERIRGREATVGVLDNYRDQRYYLLPEIEIVPPEDSVFFDYTNKYDGSTEEICPGRFSKTQKEKLAAAARAAHELLSLSQYSRSDFIVVDDDVYFLEVNTLPGLTAESLLPKSLEAIGCSYQSFITHLLTDTLNRH